jgi:hypothetical protein
MIKTILVVFVVWTLIVMTIQAMRQASGQQLISWIKLSGLGIVGAALTSVALFLIVTLF